MTHWWIYISISLSVDSQIGNNEVWVVTGAGNIYDSKEVVSISGDDEQPAVAPFTNMY